MSTVRVNSSVNLISWQRRAYESHRIRVKTATPTVDMNPPKLRPHVLYDAKRIQLQRERQGIITRDNFILLKNLEDIMHGKMKKKTSRLDEKKSKCIRSLI